MDNGVEVVAKLPNSSTGPAKYATASEVATHELVRSRPLPAEFIISEKAARVRLGLVWKQWRWKLKLNMVKQLIDMENTLIGEALSRFAIGPLTSPELWEGTRGEMGLDRGRNSSDYTRAIGWNEIAWIRAYALLRINHYRSSESIGAPSSGVALLTQYMNLAAFVGWQSAFAAPLFYQFRIPPMFEHSEHAEITAIEGDLKHETMDKYYEAIAHNLFYHRQSLISLAEQWDKPFPDTGLPSRSCSEPLTAMFEPADYEMASRNNQKFEEVFIKRAEDETEKKNRLPGSDRIMRRFDLDLNVC
ncbi:hypothetical protein BJX63DRAFT_426364 [Aspergillus granulosus]|uniref:Uncharacterized protein n=1 Tax=Aspergillus granulosus TaxID=176169 RepID=A0ABR4GSH9_9EURO